MILEGGTFKYDNNKLNKHRKVRTFKAQIIESHEHRHH